MSNNLNSIIVQADKQDLIKFVDNDLFLSGSSIVVFDFYRKNRELIENYLSNVNAGSVYSTHDFEEALYFLDELQSDCQFLFTNISRYKYAEDTEGIGIAQKFREYSPNGFLIGSSYIKSLLPHWNGIANSTYVVREASSELLDEKLNKFIIKN